MVKLHIKKGDESQFLYETTVNIPIDELMKDVVAIYNGRLKVNRICEEIKSLAEHGIMMPPNMQGLTDEQIEELKLKDEWADRCVPSGGNVYRRDEIGRRNGMAPNEQMAEILTKTVKEAKDDVSNKNVAADRCVTQVTVKDALDKLCGAIMIVYPMQLPPHDPIRMEFENTEDLTGMQASLEVLDEANASLWWAGKEMIRGKKLMDFIGKNEKTKIIAKLQKKGAGAPSREPVVSEEEQKQMMAYAYKKQEEYKKLQEADDTSYLDSAWADSNSLKKSFQGIRDIKMGPR
ncbi:cilia- and flagella-associated protein 298-A-like [Lineus longissimus]|uniref:cilia- and flagella-associated protein 298-A-like n=1 Tax=Lineus longissimus TaxID=88925 RepID=UPI002B4E96BC